MQIIIAAVIRDTSKLLVNGEAELNYYSTLIIRYS